MDDFTLYRLVQKIGFLRSLDAPELHASSDVREPISLHQSVITLYILLHLPCLESDEVVTSSTFGMFVSDRVL